MYLLQSYVIFFHPSLLYQLIATNRNHWVAVNLQTPIIYSNKMSNYLFKWYVYIVAYFGIMSEVSWHIPEGN